MKILKQKKALITKQEISDKIDQYSNKLTKLKQSSTNLVTSTLKSMSNSLPKQKFPQFFRTSSDPTPSLNMPPLPNFTAAIKTLLKELDIDNVHIDLGRSLCSRIAAYNHLPYNDWKKFQSMDLPNIKKKPHTVS